MYSQHSAALTSPQNFSRSTNKADLGNTCKWPHLVYSEVSNRTHYIDANIPAGIPENNPYVSYQPAQQHSNLAIDATLVALVVTAIVVGAAAIAKMFVVNGAVMGIASIAPFIQ